MSETHPPILDGARNFVLEGENHIATAYTGFEEAHVQVRALDGQLDSVIRTLTAATGLIEKHAAAYDIGEEFAEQALQKHISQKYGESNARAARGEVRLKRGLYNLRSEREALLGLGAALLGASQQFTDVRSSLIEVKGTLEAGMGACIKLGGRQVAVAEQIYTYIVNRDIEHGVGQNVERCFDAAQQAVQPPTRTQQPAQIAQDIEASGAPLAAHNETLLQIEAAFGRIDGIMLGIDKAITHWNGQASMPNQIPALHTEMLRVLAELNLPISAEVLNDYRKRLTLQQKNFEGATTAAEESCTFVGLAKQYIAEAVSALKQYLRRGF